MQFLQKARRLSLIPLSSLALVPSAARAEEKAAIVAPTIDVMADEEAEPKSLPAVQGTEIYDGKKTTVAKLDEQPSVANNNLRQAFTQVPGLLISEVSNQSFQSISYRGLGEPYESWNLLILKNGIPVSPDFYSYPAAYYTPPMESVERIEFLRGGSGLLYGPLPGGAVNYVTPAPVFDKKITASTKTLGGSFGLFSTYNVVQGTVGRIGYRADFDFRRSDGPRQPWDVVTTTGSVRVPGNAGFNTKGGSLTLALDADQPTRLVFNLDLYNGQFGEPGGLNLDRFKDDQTQSSTPFDRFYVTRIVPSLTFTKEFSSATQLDVRGFFGYYDRTSQRQTGTVFGSYDEGRLNNVSIIQQQKFQSAGVTARLRHDYSALSAKNTFTGALNLFGSNAPITGLKGNSPTDTEGLAGTMALVDRSTVAGSVVLENRFLWGKFAVTPGIRLEVIRQRVGERLDLAVGSATGGPPGESNGLSQNYSLAVVPLGGLGLSYQLTEKQQAYANVSRGYKPKTFNDGMIQQAGNTVAEAFAPTYSVMSELGARGRPMRWLTYDASAFSVWFEDQVGLLGEDNGRSTRQNVGAMFNYGVEGSLELNAVGLVDTLAKTKGGAKIGAINLVANASFLKGEYTSGAAKGFTPQYAPPYLIRAGANWNSGGRVKLAFLGTMVGKHFGVDNENPTFEIPAYQVWDLSGEVQLIKNRLGVIAGLNNVFDAKYYARIRPGGGGGIDPGLPRNFYAGLTGSL